jgi:hypothetical protein
MDCDIAEAAGVTQNAIAEAGIKLLFWPIIL